METAVNTSPREKETERGREEQRERHGERKGEREREEEGEGDFTVHKTPRWAVLSSTVGYHMKRLVNSNWLAMNFTAQHLVY